MDHRDDNHIPETEIFTPIGRLSERIARRELFRRSGKWAIALTVGGWLAGTGVCIWAEGSFGGRVGITPSSRILTVMDWRRTPLLKVRGFVSLTVLMTLTALLGGFSVSVASADAGGNLVVAGYRLYRAPPQMAKQCRRAQQHVHFMLLCPTLMPRTCDHVPESKACPELPQGDKGLPPQTGATWADESRGNTGFARTVWVGGSYGTEQDPYNWSANNPNYFFHFFVAEGVFTPLYLGLRGVNGGKPPQHFLGRRTIAGHVGKLYSQASYVLCGVPGCGYTGHVTFIWHQHGVTYAASLHRWSADPLDPSVLAILTTLIAHLRHV